MAALAERQPALPFEIQGGRVHEHNGEIAQQIAPPLEQPLLDQILDATGNERAIGEGLYDLENIREVMTGVGHFFDGTDGMLSDLAAAGP